MGMSIANASAYISAAYLVSGFALVFYGVWLIRDRKRLRLLKKTVHASSEG